MGVLRTYTCASAIQAEYLPQLVTLFLSDTWVRTILGLSLAGVLCMNKALRAEGAFKGEDFMRIVLRHKAATETAIRNNDATQKRSMVTSRSIAVALLMSCLWPVTLAHGVDLSSQTNMIVSPSGSVSAGTVVTLTATVTYGGVIEPYGVVSFCDVNVGCAQPNLLGSAKLSNSGVATIKFVPGVGTYAIEAIYSGTQSVPASVSAQQTLTVVGTSSYLSTTAISVSGTPGNYNITATVSAFGRPTPSGTVSFRDASDGNTLIASGSLNPTTAKASFSAPSVPPTTFGNGSVSAATGDFNNDGLADLAVVNSSDGTVSIALGRGDGSFASSTAYVVGSSPVSVAVGDFNGDGSLDLAVANSQGASVSVMLGNGDGTFLPPVTYATGNVPTWVAVSDVNNDGVLDLVVANSADNTISVLLGNGDGTFQTQVTSPTGAGPLQLAVADVNGDGHPDVITADSVDNTVSILLGNGDGTFASCTNYGAGTNPHYVAVADFNGDGIPDLAITNYGDDTVSVLLGNGDGTFQPGTTFPVGQNPGQIAVADFNRDGFLDMAVANASGNSVSILSGNGDGTFAPQVAYAAGTNPSGVVAADFNGDSLTDLAIPNNPNGASGMVKLLVGDQTVQASVSNVRVIGAGTHEVIGAYSGDASRAASASGPVALQGSLLSTTISLSSSPNPSNSGQTVVFTALVSSSSGTPAGSVMFLDGTTTLGIATLNGSGQATFSTSALSEGTHAVTATYEGDSDYNASVSPVLQQVVQGAATETTLSTSDPSVPFGTPVTFTVAVTPIPTGSQPGTINVMLGTTLLGSSSVNEQGQAQITTSKLPAGSDAITAVYSGNTQLASSTSQPVNESVSTTYTIALSSNSTEISATNPGQITVTVTPLGGAFNQPVNFSLTGLPSDVQASWKTPQVTPKSAPTTTVLTLQVASQSASKRSPFSHMVQMMAVTLIGGFVSLSGRRSQKILCLLVCLAIVSGTVVMSGCAGGTGIAPVTPPQAQTYTVTVNASSGSLDISQKLTLTVE